jgi:hypothetical protein
MFRNAADIASMQTAGDRFVDLSLRILTLVVGAVLFACLALLIYRWSAPAATSPSVTIVPVSPKTNATPTQVAAPEPAKEPEVLMAPGKMFQCVVNGRKLFSDRPCAEAAGAKK